MSDENSTGRTLAAMALLGGGGFALYKFWYEPEQRKRAAAEDLARRIAAESARTGKSPRDALHALGTAGCQAVALYYAVPPQASRDMCSLAVKLAPGIMHSMHKANMQLTRTITGGTAAGLKQAGESFKQSLVLSAKAPIVVAKAAWEPFKGPAKSVKKFFQKIF